MTKEIYGQILITAEADKDVINSTEGILYTEFDALMDKLDDVVSRWNDRGSTVKLTLKMKELDEAIT